MPEESFPGECSDIVVFDPGLDALARRSPYGLVQGSTPEELVKGVKALCRQGYMPLGGVAVVQYADTKTPLHTQTWLYVQAMAPDPAVKAPPWSYGVPTEKEY